jgi:hypothetical protein
MDARLIALVIAVVALGAAPACAADADADALDLADLKAPAPAKASDWRLYGEAARASIAARNGGVSGQQDRLSLDLNYDTRFAPGWQGVLSDRLDLFHMHAGTDRQRNVNTLRELYVSHQASAQWILDAGRINARNGIGLGYNPTDFLRTNALRSVVSSDPASLRQNRMGTLMLRNQTLWTGGSFTAIAAPRVSSHRSDDTFDVDIGATNAHDQWLLSASQELAPGISPQLLLYQQDGGKVQLGFNGTLLLDDATVVYGEWSGGRGPSLVSALPGQPASEQALSWRSRYAVGLRTSLPLGAVWTVELEGDNAAPTSPQWDALMQGPPQVYGLYRQYVAAQQELPTRHALFTHVLWEKAFLDHLDLSGYWRGDLVDHSHTTWAEARYHWDSFDLALKMQYNTGRAFTDFGGMPQRRQVQLLAVYYLM